MFVVGFAMQLALGGLNTAALAWPVSGIIAAVIVLAIAALTLYREKAFFRRFVGIPFSVSLIGTMVVCCVVMGLVPQHGMLVGGLLSRAGIYAITSSWPFVLLYLTLLLSLGCLTADILISTGLRRWGFLLNHLGLWLVLLGAGVGSADYRDLRVAINEGESADHASVRDGSTVPMPFAIRLDDFRMEEYPARWGVVDIRTGKFQPEKHPVFYDTEDEAFAANPSPGMHGRIASTMPEPSYFASDIAIVTPEGERTATIEVNRPYSGGSWTVYQYGYDHKAGKDSAYSILQLVRDPWLTVVYAGIVMLALGALSLFVKRKKPQVDGLE